MIVLLAVSLSFTVPQYEPDTLQGTCEAYSRYQIPERPLTLKVEGWALDGPDRLLEERGVAPGFQSLSLPWDGTPWTFCLTTKDPSGNESCRKCVAVGTWPVDVPHGSTVEVETYDVAGRKVLGTPNRPGVYFRRWLVNRSVVRSRPVIVLP